MKTVVEIRLCFEFEGDLASDHVDRAALHLATALIDHHIPDLVCSTDAYSPIGEFDKLSANSTVYLR